MNLRQLSQFVALAETGNFHRAAERLHMAQPPLSVSIRKLEEELGSPLFERTTTGVVLTPAGEAMLGDARRALFHAQRAPSTLMRINFATTQEAAFWTKLQRARDALAA